ncbi:MAG: hypothetical protein ABIJ43_00805 [Candidatus Beckwithbacteria bacterium]
MKIFKNKWFLLTLVGFIITRVYILLNPPLYYSDVSHDYIRYANMWYQGLTPYLKHFYEYPPFTLPLLYLPLLIEKAGIGFYYLNFRLMTFFLEVIIFFSFFKIINQFKISKIKKVISLVFYLVAGVIAKDFYYEGIDLVFISSLLIAMFYSLNQSKAWLNRFWFWFFFWLSTSIKFMSAPLLAIYLYLTKLNLKKELKAISLAFLAIWGIPLAIFRSSLAVMFVFHARRGLKYASFPSFIVETINYWTNTEIRLNKAPDFELQGPISSIAEKVVSIVFPLSILIVIFYGLFIVLKPNFKNISTTLKKLFLLEKIKLNHLDPYAFSLKFALIYILTIFLTGKVFSQPFHIWLIPLTALYPFKSIKKQLMFMALVLWLLVIDTTPWLNFINEGTMVIEPLPAKFFMYSARFLPMFILLFSSIKLPNKYEKA